MSCAALSCARPSQPSVNAQLSAASAATKCSALDGRATSGGSAVLVHALRPGAQQRHCPRQLRSMYSTAHGPAPFSTADHYIRPPGCYVQLADNTLQPRGFFQQQPGPGHHEVLMSSLSSDNHPGIAEALAVANYRSLSDDTVPIPLQQREDMRTSENIPVFCMLPLDTINAEGVFRYASITWFSQALQLLAASGVHGVAVDVWWSAVEKSPRSYNWLGYKQLFEMLRNSGLKIQVVLSFHACGGNVGDLAEIPLPGWVLEAGRQDPDIFFTDRPRENGRGQRNKEYISIFADEVPALAGRTPLQCYEDFMLAFRDMFAAELQTGLIEEVVVGMGPCGELRYPAYLEANGWRFPGVGEFQCYDRHALASLAQAAAEVGHREWGYAGPHDSGTYNSRPYETGFFAPGGSYESPYGQFFLTWYSNSLLQHGEKLSVIANQVFAPFRTRSKCSSSSRSPVAHAHALLQRIQDFIAGNGGTAAMVAAAVAAAAAVLGLPGDGGGLLVDTGIVPANGSVGPCISPAQFQGAEASALGTTAAAAAAARVSLRTGAAHGSLQPAGALGIVPAAATPAAAAAASPSPSATTAALNTPGSRVTPRSSSSGSASSSSGMLKQAQDSCSSLATAASMGSLVTLFNGVASTQQQQQQQQRPLSHTSDSWHNHISSRGAGDGVVQHVQVQQEQQQGAGAGTAAAGSPMHMELSEPNLSGLVPDACAAKGPGGTPLPGDAAAGLPGLAALQGLLHRHTTGPAQGEQSGSLPASAAAATATAGAAQGWDSSTASVESDTHAAIEPAAVEAPQVREAQQGSLVAAAAAAAARAAAVAAAGPEGPSSSLAGSLLSALKEALAGVGEGALTLMSGSRPDNHRQQQAGNPLQRQSLQRQSHGNSPSPLVLTMKIAGVHWWYRHSSHASELTAGYYNTDTRDGYQPVLELCARHSLNLTLTCVEMCDAQHPQHAQCGPEGLLRQIRAHAAVLHVSLSGENALPIFQISGVDTTAMDRIISNTRACSNAGLRSCTSWPGTGPSAGSTLGNIVSTGRTFSEVGRLLMPVQEGSCSSLSQSASDSSLEAQAQQLLAQQQQQQGLGGPQQLHGGADAVRLQLPAGGRHGGSRLSPHHHQQPQHHQQHGSHQHQHHASGHPPAVLPAMRSFTFLRLGPEFLQPDYQVPWMRFMYKMLNERS